MRAGRFGPYVTEGTVNASLRRGDDPDSLTLERAAELLAERRAAGPRTPRRARAAKKTVAKKTVAKKSAAKRATNADPATSARKKVARRTRPG